jgi:hypothetical protein
MKTIIKVIGRDRIGKPCVEPDFPDHAVYLHPVPSSFHDLVHFGETWSGRYGIIRDTQRESRDGKRIYVRYFIPIEKTTVNMALKQKGSSLK